jgi:hypothetical protein
VVTVGGGGGVGVQTSLPLAVKKFEGAPQLPG